jgi:hypothetical protein
MPRTRHRQLACATLLCSVAVAACSARKPVASSGPAFHLISSQEDSLLFPPSIPLNQPSTETIHLTIPGRIDSASNAKCSAEQGPFRLATDPQSPPAIQISMPSPARWLSDLDGKNEPDSSSEVEALDAFLTHVDRLQQARCFSVGDDGKANTNGNGTEANTGAPVRDLILQAIPMRPRESYFNVYDYRLGHSGMDLKPGLRVKIERAYFRPPQAGEEENGVAAFLGLSTIAFDVVRDAGEETKFHQSGEIQYSPATIRSTASEATRYSNLAQLPPQRRYRLYFYTYLVSEKHRRAAAIIGAADTGQLEALDSQFRANPDQTCESAPLPTGVTCTDFDGFVTLSTQVQIEVNNQPRFVEWGVRVDDLLAKSPSARQLRSLRLQRRFGLNEMYDVRFDPKDENVLSLVLVGGDRINWSK